MPAADLLSRPHCPVQTEACLAVALMFAVAHAGTPETNAGGVFLNSSGGVLTARHSAADCRSLFAIKGAQMAQARVGAWC